MGIYNLRDELVLGDVPVKTRIYAGEKNVSVPYLLFW